MNPQTKYEEGDTETTRAFITLFREYGDLFKFAIDSQVDDDDEVRAYLMPNGTRDCSETVIGVTAINNKSIFEDVVTAIKELGLTVLEQDSVTKYDETIGEYTAHTLTAKAPDDLQADWNVPHFLVYGSISPPLEDACYNAFGSACNFTNIRNHFVIYGTDINTDSKTELATAVQQSTEFFDDRKRDIVSSINTSTLI